VILQQELFHELLIFAYMTNSMSGSWNILKLGMEKVVIGQANQLSMHNFQLSTINFDLFLWFTNDYWSGGCLVCSSTLVGSYIDDQILGFKLILSY